MRKRVTQPDLPLPSPSPTLQPTRLPTPHTTAKPPRSHPSLSRMLQLLQPDPQLLQPPVPALPALRHLLQPQLQRRHTAMRVRVRLHRRRHLHLSRPAVAAAVAATAAAIHHVRHAKSKCKNLPLVICRCKRGTRLTVFAPFGIRFYQSCPTRPDSF